MQFSGPTHHPVEEVIGYELVNVARHRLTIRRTNFRWRERPDGIISLMLLGGLDRRTECGNKWSPASVDEFSRTAEKYYRDGDQLGATM